MAARFSSWDESSVQRRAVGECQTRWYMSVHVLAIGKELPVTEGDGRDREGRVGNAGEGSVTGPNF